MPRKVESIGPSDASIMLVGESPGADEELEGAPFVGASGKELTRMLREVGIDRTACYITNVCKYRPPGNRIGAWITDKKKVADAKGWTHYKDGFWMNDLVWEGLHELFDEIERVQPDLILGFGNTPLWALTYDTGIIKWRGSQITLPDTHFVPTYHPAAILRQWAWRHLAVTDLTRAVDWMRAGFAVPTYTFSPKPRFAALFDYINQIQPGSIVALDVETGNGHIVCIGIARSPLDAMCLPLITTEGPYWEPNERILLLDLLRTRLNNAYVVGQNFSYDSAYFLADFGWHPRLDFDTYTAQSVLWPGEPRNLGFLSSINCHYHLYWKDDAKEWFKLKSAFDYDRLFAYNCEDAARTFEIALRQREALMQAGLVTQFQSMQDYSANVFTMSQRGVFRDPIRTKQLDHDITEVLQCNALRLANLAGHPINCDSPKQVATYFYTELGCKEQRLKRSKEGEATVTTGDEALEKLLDLYPQYTEQINLILSSRSLRSLRSNFLRAEREPDGMLRSNFTACGTETFRLTSAKNAFGRGCNLLNVTADTVGVNLRNCIVPPLGSLYFDCDLERADLQVVVWEADDEALKRIMREGADIHLVNAVELYNLAGIPYDECFESHPNYQDHVARVGKARALGKRFVHLTNYGGGARKCAVACSVRVHEAEMAQRRWFSLHPGIKDWHTATKARLTATRTVTNRFGYRRVFFDRIDALLPEALAWVPQSTVALVIAEIHRRFDTISGLEVQLQCYDSLAGHYRCEEEARILPLMQAASHVVIPYRDPLIIPLGLKTGPSWGEVKARNWS